MLIFFLVIGKCIKGDKDLDIVIFKEMLESGVGIVFVEFWMDKLDLFVRRDVYGFKKQREKFCVFLRVVCNKIEYFEKFGNYFWEFYFGSCEGVVQYYVDCFLKFLFFIYCML